MTLVLATVLYLLFAVLVGKTLAYAGKNDGLGDEPAGAPFGKRESLEKPAPFPIAHGVEPEPASPSREKSPTP